MPAASAPIVHRFEARAFPVNAFLVEAERGIVVIDALLTASDSTALDEHVQATGKPLLGVLVTHSHPDHYGGLTSLAGGDAVPIIATEGVDRVIRRDDDSKDAILRPMFGDEWPRRRTFPNRTVQDSERVELGGLGFRVIDLGPGESPHDSIWVLEDDEPRAFVGDLVYNHMHAYLADGHYEAWLANIERARGIFEPDTVFYPGHGEPGTRALLDWQEGYIRTFVGAARAVAHAASSDAAATEAATAYITTAMQEYLSGDDLLFLMQLSVGPVLDQLRVSEPAAGA